MSSKKSLTEKHLKFEQQKAVDHLYGQDNSILVAATGAGKTCITLTAVAELQAKGVIGSVVIAAPAKVIETGVWPVEASKWAHLRGLRIVAVVGTPEQRGQLVAAPADIYVVSLNNLGSFLHLKHGCDGIVLDELSKASGKQARRLASRKYGSMFKWRVGLTATPVSQDFTKLFSMVKILDGSLGRSKEKYMNEYFTCDHHGYSWTIREGSEQKILDKIAHLVHVVPDNKADTLPPLFREEIRFNMSPEAREAYDDMRRDMVALDIDKPNAAAASGALRQIATGFLYDRVTDGVITLDTARFDALLQWHAALDGRPGLIFYEYVEQGRQIAAARLANTTAYQITSMSHGVDGLQDKFADACMVQPNWSNDVRLQSEGRLWRTGQKKPVHITTLVCSDSLDDVVIDRVEGREGWMERFLKHLGGKQDDV